MPNCDKCIWSTRSGNCVLWECKFVSYEDARRMIEEKERKDEKTVRTMTIEQAIEHAEEVARANESLASNYERDKKIAEIHRQIAELLRELQDRRKADSCEGCVYEGCDCLLCVTCRRICKDKYKPERRTDD